MVPLASTGWTAPQAAEMTVGSVPKKTRWSSLPHWVLLAVNDDRSVMYSSDKHFRVGSELARFEAHAYRAWISCFPLLINLFIADGGPDLLVLVGARQLAHHESATTARACMEIALPR
jgi:hypothetical protein